MMINKGQNMSIVFNDKPCIYNIMSMKFERYNIYNEGRQYFKNKSYVMSIM